MPIVTQNWDGVTAPSMSFAGWTYAVGWTSTTAQQYTSPNSITFTPANAVKSVTWGTVDSASGNVQATCKFYLDNSLSFGEPIFGLVIRSGSTPIDDTTGTYYAAEVACDSSFSGAWSITLCKVAAGTRTSLATIGSITSSSSATAWFELALAASGTALTVSLKRMSDGKYLNSSGSFSGTTPVNCLTATDSSISGSGYSGIYATSTGFNGNPLYADDFSLDAYGSTPVTASASALAGSGTLGTATVGISLGNLIGHGTLAAAAASAGVSVATAPLVGSPAFGAGDSVSLAIDVPASSLAGAGTLGSATIDFTDYTVFVQPFELAGTLGVGEAGILSIADVSALAGSGTLASGLAVAVAFTTFPPVLIGSGQFGNHQGVGSGSTIAAAPLVARGTLAGVAVVNQGTVSISVGALAGTGTIGTVRTWLNVGDILYDVYRNAGDGGPIDYTTPAAVLSTRTWSTGTLAYPAHHKFGVRCYSLRFNLEEKNLDASWELILDATGADVTHRPMPPSALRAIPRQGGAMLVEWSYPVRDPLKTPTGFDVYVGSSGAPDYSTAAATIAYDGTDSYRALVTGLTDAQQYWFGVRAFNSSGEEPNTASVSAIADATGPAPPTSLTAVVS